MEDTSHPDDSIVYYGKPFTKGWVIENTGTKTWKRVKLVYQNGFHPDESEIDVPDLEPGKQVRISFNTSDVLWHFSNFWCYCCVQVEMVASYPPISLSDGVEIKSSWRLVHDGHTPFGDTLWLSIIAQPGELGGIAGTFSC